MPKDFVKQQHNYRLHTDAELHTSRTAMLGLRGFRFVVGSDRPLRCAGEAVNSTDGTVEIFRYYGNPGNTEAEED